MNRLFLIGSVVAAVVLASPAHAEHERHCDVPMSDWQPRDALIAQVESLGWKVLRVRTDDGCYLVYGQNERGEKVVGKFDPATLKIIRMIVDYDD
ncbi:PepSY domain-containing protein [Oryzibacter oryziterrae]|uniref:PepSY domain-containing protein n=1 Tax=Oryzibacter oryziterrae TaxID=2766474 RepID=UPI001F2C5AD9|nr:PepSY domain-containing protein [Oryzibacter oryziterrae]